jgi:hypothetical protein
MKHIFTTLMKLPSKLVTSLKSFTLPIIKSNVVKNTTSRFTIAQTTPANTLKSQRVLRVRVRGIRYDIIKKL